MVSLNTMGIAKDVVKPGELNLPTLGEVPIKREMFQEMHYCLYRS